MPSQKRYKLLGLCLIVCIVYYIFCLPSKLFDTPYAKVLVDESGQLLSASISADGQWRFPPIDSVPHKFATALIQFEDRRFYSHWGVDLQSVARAIHQNISNRKVVSGASTLSMQVMRLSAPQNKRNLFNKIQEMIKATRLEFRLSKEEILELYTSHAPFGGNVVGLEAACWRYYSKAPDLLTWSEAATLAVLPNAPALIHPGRNRKELQEKRNRLLAKLLDTGHIDSLSYNLSVDEPIPVAPKALPRWANHLMHTAYRYGDQKSREGKIKSSIDIHLQKEVHRIIGQSHSVNDAEFIHNSAALVIHVPSGKVKAYIGNAPNAGFKNQGDVDIVMAPRSTGSILKPFLYALCLQDGKYLPDAMIKDVPIQLQGYAPKNFDRKFSGVVPFSQALSRSLNVPFVNALQEYNLEKFYDFLQDADYSHITASPNHYGLSLILGGAEANLWDLSSTYVSMARTLRDYPNTNGTYQASDFDKASWLANHEIPTMKRTEHSDFLSASAIWHTFKAMQQVKRPDEEGHWENFDSAVNIAWKTGTSFGFKDAWAIGVNAEYVVGVWVGNADGEGRPGLIGVKKAAPILFDIFKQLPRSDWFEPPYDDMVQMPVCRKSGYRSHKDVCPTVDTIWAPQQGLKADICPMHQVVFTNQQGDRQVNATCYPRAQMQKKTFFVLNPTAAYFYKRFDPQYQALPVLAQGCSTTKAKQRNMEFIYPKANDKIYIPIELDGKLGKAIFKVAHILDGEVLYWHLGEEYLGSTSEFHEMALQPPYGKNKITVIDSKGNRISQNFEILNNQKTGNK